MRRALQIFNHNAEPFGFMIQCPKCLWWTNSPRWHASTCQFRAISMEQINEEIRQAEAAPMPEVARLILKDNVKIDGAPRVNKMKISLTEDGRFVMWITNGENKWARFTLTERTAEQLKDFLLRK